MIEKNTFEYNNERAVLVALITPSQNETKAREYLSELAFLAETAGAEAVKSFLQRVEKVSDTHLRAHETHEHRVCRLLLEKKKVEDDKVINKQL